MAMQRIAIVDYGGGNLASAQRALRLAADWLGLSVSLIMTSDPDMIRVSDRVVLPGQGAFADCAKGLKAADGLWDAIETVTRAGAPYLGICVGMQLMGQYGLEHGVTPGFSWLQGVVAKLTTPGLRLPQMG